MHLTITNRSLLRTSSLMLEDALPEQVNGKARFVLDPLTAHESRPVSYRIPALGRGRYRVGPLRMRVTDPFGLIDLTRSFSSISEFVVTPVVDRLPDIEPPRSEELGDLAGGGSVGSNGADDQSTREYRTGDDLRRIHWRSSARTGSLMVRQEERPWQGQNTVLFDMRSAAHVTSPSHDPATEAAPADVRLTSSFEWAVSAVGSIGSHVMANGRRFGLLADPAAGEQVRFGDPTRLSAYLAEVRPSSRSDLIQMAQLMREAARDSTLIAVLGRVDADALRVLVDANARGRSTPAYAMLLDVDSWSTPAPPHQELGTGLGETARATASLLYSAGWRVTVVRRGDTIADAWQSMLSRTGFGSVHDARTAVAR